MKTMDRCGGAKYECLLFDMDDTLYPSSSGLNLACRKNIQDFMLHYLQIEESEVPKMCLDLYREHGTTMAGLKELGFEFDNDEFHAHVHGKLPYAEMLKPDTALRSLLLSMPQRKIIFTNADKAHAAQVLHRLGLEDCFEGVICFETLNPPLDNKVQICSPAPGERMNKSPILCKPSLEAFQAAIRIANINPSKTIFFDDSARNIASGKAAGFYTVMVGSSDVVAAAGADHALSSVHNMKEGLPEIWKNSETETAHVDQIMESTTTAQTLVLA